MPPLRRWTRLRCAVIRLDAGFPCRPRHALKRPTTPFPTWAAAAQALTLSLRSFVRRLRRSVRHWPDSQRGLSGASLPTGARSARWGSRTSRVARCCLGAPSGSVGAWAPADPRFRAWRAPHFVRPPLAERSLRGSGALLFAAGRGCARSGSLNATPDCLPPLLQLSTCVSAAYSSGFKYHRCLIPADGYYEWQKVGKTKQPWYIHAADGQPMAFAGLFDVWLAPTGDELHSATTSRRARVRRQSTSMTACR